MCLLGAYQEQELVALMICCVVDRILIGKSLINSEKSIPLRAQDLLFHYAREELAKNYNVELSLKGFKQLLFLSILFINISEIYFL